jgi:ATP-dependent DNA ligase
VLGVDGVTTFVVLQDALSRGQAERLTYHVFDLLHLDGRDPTGLPLTERKAILEKLLAKLIQGGGSRPTRDRLAHQQGEPQWERLPLRLYS